MPTINIQMLGGDFEPTTDYIIGRPTVNANAWIDGNDAIVGQPALIDTGSNRSMVRSDVVVGLVSIGRDRIDATLGQGDTDLFVATVQIAGFHERFEIVVGVSPNLPYHLLIGRDILSHYTMVYDC